MSGADWDAILSSDPRLDLAGLDVNAVVQQLGTLSREQRDDLVARINEEKAKVVKRGNLIDTALDVFSAVLGVVT